MKKPITIAVISLLGLVLTAAIIDLNSLFNYQDQDTPSYISDDNTPSDNHISDAGATLGRVLFYDRNLSINNSIACASCHKQEFAFGDTDLASIGVNGSTGRHSMRLINARHSAEVKAFWDERADSFEDQATMPIQDHVEMGFSGEFGDPSIDSLITKLGEIAYYNTLFDFVFGDPEITETRIQKALAQFVRSIESYDSRFDVGRAQVSNVTTDFPNFTPQENEGKDLFFSPPPFGGAACFRCHGGSEFSIINNTDNNGVIGVIGDPDALDLTVTKAPTLRDLVNPQGLANGQFMHDGSLTSLMQVIDHYNDLEEVPENTNLDFRLAGTMHDLDLSQSQKEALEAFLLTLTGEDVYVNEKWSNPFEENGDIVIIPLDPNGLDEYSNTFNLDIYPNPTTNVLNLNLPIGTYQMFIFNEAGMKVKSSLINGLHSEDISELANGLYIVAIVDLKTNKVSSKQIVKR